MLAMAVVIGLIGFGGANAASPLEVNGTYSGKVLSMQIHNLSVHPFFCVSTGPGPCTTTNNVNIIQPVGGTFVGPNGECCAATTTLALSPNLSTTPGDGLVRGHVDTGATMTLTLSGITLTGTLTTNNVTVQIIGVQVYTNFFLLNALLTQTGQSETGKFSGSGSLFTKAVTGSTSVFNFTASGVDVDGKLETVSGTFSKP
jgi:hypothetical protein